MDFDARSIFLPEKLIKEGLNFWRIGDGSEYEKGTS